MKKPVIFIVMLLLVMVAYIYWPAEQAAQQQRGGGGALVELYDVKQQEFNDIITALGNAQANESVILMAQSTDRVRSVYFDDGDVVTTGTKLVALEHAEEQAAVQELTVTLAEQKRQLQRLLELEKQSASAESAIDAQKALVETTAARLAGAKIQLKEKFINAPFSGVLGMRQISPGQLVTNSTEITTLDDLSQIKVEFTLPEKYLNQVALKQPVSATNVAYNTPFTGVINSISPRIDPVTRAFKVRALFANEEQHLKPGMLLQLKVQTSTETALVVPESSIIPINSEHYVFVANGDKVTRTLVEIGRRKPGVVEVLSGIESGQQVVHKGVLKLRDGSPITVAGAAQQVANKG